MDAGSATLEDAGLPSRVVVALAKHKVKTVNDLSGMTRAELSEVKGLGEKALEEIEHVAKKYGVTLK